MSMVSAVRMLSHPDGALALVARCIILYFALRKSTWVESLVEKVKKSNSLGIRVDPETKAALEKAADDDTRTCASLIEKILSQWLRANGYMPDRPRRK